MPIAPCPASILAANDGVLSRPLTAPFPSEEHWSMSTYNLGSGAMEHRCQCCGEIADDVFCDDCKAHMSAEAQSVDAEPAREFDSGTKVQEG
jgi:hypothetical protein